MSDAHDGKTVLCHHVPADASAEAAVENTDPRTLRFEDHGRFVPHLNGTDDRGKPLRERFEASALRFDCPDCGRTYWVCPVCSDPDENTPAGWFRGDSTGEQLACHNCNATEAARQDRGRV